MEKREVFDLYEDAAAGKISFKQALEELNKMNFQKPIFEEHRERLRRIIGDKDDLLKEPIFQVSGIPNSIYYKVLQDSISQIRQNKYIHEIGQHLFDTYSINATLINYFLNEATTIVKMNSLSPEEVETVGRAWNNAMLIALQNAAVKTKKRKKKDENFEKAIQESE